MKIAMPYVGVGGARTWIDLFSKFLIDNRHEVIQDLEADYQILINVANAVQLPQLQKISAQGRKILYRMDGLYWEYLFPPGVSNVKNQDLKKVMLCSDVIVFQSNFVKNQVCKSLDQEILGEVIYNAADPEVFKLNGEKLTKPEGKKVILCGGNWGPPFLALKLLENYLAVAKLLEKEPFEFWLYGNAPSVVKDKLNGLLPLSNINICFLEKIDHQLMPKFLHTADVLLYIRPNDPCPNLVLEAMQCGTPIVALQSGSLPELLEEAALLAKCEETTVHYPEADLSEIVNNLKLTIEKQEFFQEKMIQQAKNFTLGKMGKKYMNVIESLLHI